MRPRPNYSWRRLANCVVAGSLAIASCSSARQTGNTSATPAETVLTVEELDRMPLSSSLLQAVEGLRPLWLIKARTRARSAVQPAEISVFTNGVWQGGLEVLEQRRVDEVLQLQYMNATDARLRFGARVNGPAILVTTRPVRGAG